LIQNGLAGNLAWDGSGSRLALNTLQGAGIFSVHTLSLLDLLETSITPASLAFSVVPFDDMLVTADREPETGRDTVTLWSDRGTLEQVLIGHTDWVNSVAFSPVSDWVASGSDDTTVRLWNASEGTEVLILEGHTGPVTEVAFSADGELVGSSSVDGTARLRRVSDGQLVRSLEGHSAGLLAIAFSPDGITVATAGEDGVVYVWVAGTGSLVHKFSGHRGPVTSLSFSEDLLASAGRDGSVRLWDIKYGTELAILTDHVDSVLSVSFSPDGKLLASGSLDGTVRIWGIGESPATSPPPTPTSEAVDAPPRVVREGPGFISSVNMLNETEGWAFGGFEPSDQHVLATDDGGLSWLDVDPGSTSGSVPAAATLDRQHAWIVYYPSDLQAVPAPSDVWSTSSGGSSWTRTVLPEALEINERPPDLDFVDANTGWILGETFAGLGQHAFTLFATNDGGATWETLVAPQEALSTCHTTGMDFVDSEHGWISERCPGGVFIEATTDGGRSFTQAALPAPANEPTLFESGSTCETRNPHLFAAQQGVVLVACDPPARAILYLTADGGKTWETAAYPGGELQFMDADIGWALSDRVYRTTNGGKTWDFVRSVGWDGQFSFVNDEIGWAVARGNGELAFVMTSDGANRWKLIEAMLRSEQPE
jgi:photosystem II stability/assembly factor-like uncharacterized protein